MHTFFVAIEIAETHICRVETGSSRLAEKSGSRIGNLVGRPILENCFEFFDDLAVCRRQYPVLAHHACKLESRPHVHEGRVCVMEMDSAKRSKLIKQIKGGRQTGAIQWTRVILLLVTAVELFGVTSDVFLGKASLGLVFETVVMVFIVAVAAMGLGNLELNERFGALLELIGEEKQNK